MLLLVEALTIEQLASESGMTVRNIRAHRARGLLPAPEVRERVGYYGPEHVARLKLIQQMQADGFNLRAIQRLLELGGGAAALLGDERDHRVARALAQLVAVEVDAAHPGVRRKRHKSRAELA